MLTIKNLIFKNIWLLKIFNEKIWKWGYNQWKIKIIYLNYKTYCIYNVY